jgi:hypothetical protein
MHLALVISFKARLGVHGKLSNVDLASCNAQLCAAVLKLCIYARSKTALCNREACKNNNIIIMPADP